MRTLTLKLILAFLAVSLSGTILLAVLAGRTAANEFGSFMHNQNQDSLVILLADYYRANEGWADVESQIALGGMGMGMGSRGNSNSGDSFGLADATGQMIVAGSGHPIGEFLTDAEIAQGAPIFVDGKLVATVIVGRGMFEMMSPAGEEFLDSFAESLFLASLGATALALFLGIWLAQSITRPLRDLKTATQAVASGDFDQEVPVRSSDEVGELAISFNQMSSDLSKARDLRRQMTADIAHELRTPLSVILGHSEALRDQVLPATPETIAIIHEEAIRLNRLVEDLRMLSLAEAGELELIPRPTQPGALLEKAIVDWAPRAQQHNIALSSQIAPNLQLVNVDPDRMAQVLGNLLDNAIRHTPAGGSVTLAAYSDPITRKLQLSLRDTGSGISAENLPHIFDRFYRADKARQRDKGGSGLGLAIAKSIVEAHGGRIWAESKPGEGATFIVQLPN